MRVLKSASEINREIRRLMSLHSHLEWAVAWAGKGFEAFDALLAERAKIRRIVVGLHFYQTHPEFISKFVDDERVRFIPGTGGVFHPKVYLFESDDGAWECLIGSANFTGGGMDGNTEMAVLVCGDDENAEEAHTVIRGELDAWWRRGDTYSAEKLEAYKVKWREKEPLRKDLAGTFGRSRKRRRTDDNGDGGLDPTESSILFKTWSAFFAEVQNDKNHTVEGRCEVLDGARGFFAKWDHFADMPLDVRQKIAGTVRPVSSGSTDWLWFGSMRGAGNFMKAVNRNDPHLSEALDRIPLEGAVIREHFDGFFTEFSQAFGGGRGGGRGAIATATRLLAMKRPDYFVCVDSKNRTRVCGEFKIRNSIGLDDYWESICMRIQQAAWWSTPEPTAPLERAVWLGRAAFLDALFYER